ncbi:hypothetical protein F5Y00DRAFT_273942 [Daldinia vernicosa]|uniref:uncharacterized protein n=1 Tax=Daldinia vernicosa TaxID=114800 RepID=UPI002007A254|nr:uncharacterized protein F5Y00DRAFT_273942 [Daldinia vernicosa]KAI0844611.1 hypothetical protein F5Y00DRAFT_273942 [Daldinia vernicosa]
MGRPNVKEDAQRVFDILKGGGIAICPADVGYAVMATNAKSLEKIFLTKQRGAHKRHAGIGSYAIHKEVHIMEPLQHEIIDHLTQDLDIPVGVIARYKRDHPMVKNIDPVTMEACDVNGSLSILVNAGAFQDALTSLTFAENIPLLGSSANLSGTGTKYRVDDINKELIDIADIVIDYGLLKWWVHGRSSTLLDFSGPSVEVIRIGACYDVIRDVLKRRWNIELPADPGMESLRFGHLRNLDPVKSLQDLITPIQK